MATRPSGWAKTIRRTIVGMIRRTPLRRTGFKRQVTPKLQKERARYSKLRRAFMELPENHWCPVAASGVLECYGEESGINTNRRQRTTDVHHRGGREGKLLNNVSKWMAVSRAGHLFINEHPNAARLHGWLI